MADMQEFPENWEDFIKMHEFDDSAEVYTNGVLLVPSFRVGQMVEHYFADRFIELPVDSEGVPIKPGDVLDYTFPEEKLWNGARASAIHVHDTIEFIVWDGERWDFIDGTGGDTRGTASLDDFYKYARHYKPDTEEQTEREAVRCRDCMYFTPGEEQPPIDWCSYFHDEVTPLGFCAWGERSE